MVTIPALEEGDPCGREGCTGTMVLTEAENCSCHISPPCGACLSVRFVCQECEWDEEEA